MLLFLTTKHAVVTSRANQQLFKIIVLLLSPHWTSRCRRNFRLNRWIQGSKHAMRITCLYIIIYVSNIAIAPLGPTALSMDVFARFLIKITQHFRFPEKQNKMASGLFSRKPIQTSYACQYDVTSLVSDFQRRAKCSSKRRDQNFNFITEILFRFLGFGDFKVTIRQLHDDVILLQLPESLSLLFSCAN